MKVTTEYARTRHGLRTYHRVTGDDGIRGSVAMMPEWASGTRWQVHREPWDFIVIVHSEGAAVHLAATGYHPNGEKP